MKSHFGPCDMSFLKSHVILYERTGINDFKTFGRNKDKDPEKQIMEEKNEKKRRFVEEVEEVVVRAKRVKKISGDEKVVESTIRLLQSLMDYARLCDFWVTSRFAGKPVSFVTKAEVEKVHVQAAIAVRATEFMLCDFLETIKGNCEKTLCEVVCEYFDDFGSVGLSKFLKIVEAGEGGKEKSEMVRSAYCYQDNPVSWIVRGLFADISHVYGSSVDVPPNEYGWSVEGEGKNLDFVEAFRTEHPDWKPAMFGEVEAAADELAKVVQPGVCKSAPMSGFVWHNGEEVKIEAQPEGFEVGTHPYGQTFRTVPVGEKGSSEEVDCEDCILGDDDGDGPTPRLFKEFLYPY
jgi:hypothetical protein